MCSFILFSLFYLVNFLVKIKTDDSGITINMNCEGNQYYNSINRNCEQCTSNYPIYNNICYSRPISIYGKNISTNLRCGDDEYLTELDEEGNHLGRFACAKTKISYNGTINLIRDNDNSFTFNIFKDIKIPENGYDPAVFRLGEFNSTEINYSIDVCFNGTYEKSCQYLANLCVLSLYNGATTFCNQIFQFERSKSM
jgi:hypothetical protein